MARTSITPVSITTAGMTPSHSLVDAVNGMFLSYRVGRFIWLKNPNAAACIVTMHVGPAGVLDSGSAPDRLVTVPSLTGERLIGLHPEYIQVDGNIYLDFTVSATATIMVVDPE